MSLSLFAGSFSRSYEAKTARWIKKLEAKVGQPCDWDESAMAPHRDVESGGFETWSALQMLVKFHQQPHLARPKAVPEWNDGHPIWKAALAPHAPHRFDPLEGPGNWLPIDFAGSVRMKNVSGNEEQTYGSVFALCRQLETLNDEVFQASDETLVLWRTTHDEAQATRDPFTYYARWGVSIYLEMARWAVQHRVPLMLSY